MKNLSPGYENMTMNRIDSKIWALMCVILYHSVCLLHHRMCFQYSLHLKVKLNEIKRFSHESVLLRDSIFTRDRFTLQSKQTFEIQHIHLSNIQFYSFLKLSFSVPAQADCEKILNSKLIYRDL